MLSAPQMLSLKPFTVVGDFFAEARDISSYFKKYSIKERKEELRLVIYSRYGHDIIYYVAARVRRACHDASD